jgi:hypothetical protein
MFFNSFLLQFLIFDFLKIFLISINLLKIRKIPHSQTNQPLMGQRKRLSETDVQLLNTMYCDGSGGTTWKLYLKN